MLESSLTRKIKSKAFELGFSEIGITQAVTLTEEAGYLAEWLSKKYHAGMQWMENEMEKRANPYLVFPQVKSIVCVAMNYFYPGKQSENPETGKISRYAWGDDYHIVITERLGELLDFIKSEIPGIKGRIYVDTGLVMDKVWAAKAGVGWMGKHTNIITQKFGSWVFLGEILLDIELDYDNPIAGMCGTCTACIDACPTKAIIKPYTVDSSKCISYLTIEHRGELPNEIVANFQNWVYGCDICQEVCPWNRFQNKTGEKVFYPRQENIAPKLTELAKMSREEFNRRFYRSPVKRAKHTGLTRNAKYILESVESSK